MHKKYEILMDDEHTKSLLIYGKIHEVYRIRALKSFSDVKRGDFGGYVQSEKNLSQGGLCWIYDDAVVLQNARIADAAKVSNSAIVRNNALVGGEAKISDTCNIEDNTIISENAKIYGNSTIRDKARVFGNAEVYGSAAVTGNSSISDNAEVFGNAVIYGDAAIHGVTKIYENAKVGGYAEIFNYAEVFGNAIVDGANIRIFENAKIFGDAYIKSGTAICGFEEVSTGNGLYESTNVTEDDTSEVVYVIKHANKKGKVLRLCGKIMHFPNKQLADMVSDNFTKENNVPTVVVPVDKDVMLAFEDLYSYAIPKP